MTDQEVSKMFLMVKAAYPRTFKDYDENMIANYIDACLALEGDRFEYEMNMLLDACSRKLSIREVEIETVYIDNNRASHFRAMRDGLRIYRLMFGYKKKHKK